MKATIRPCYTVREEERTEPETETVRSVFGVISMRSVSFPFYNSKAWKQCRAAYMRTVSGLCEVCMARGLIRPAVIVHHKIHLDDQKANDPDIALNFDNLQAVCIECHNAIHYGKRQKRRYEIEGGDVLICEQPPVSEN